MSAQPAQNVLLARIPRVAQFICQDGMTCEATCPWIVVQCFITG